MAIRILLADDHILLRDGVRMLLESQGDLQVVAEAGNGIEALSKARETRPDVAILDIGMPEMNGLETTKLILQAVPATRVMILSRHEKEAFAHQALRAGAHGFVVKGSPGAELLMGLRAIAAGQFYLSPQIQAGVIGTYLDNHENPDAKGLEQLSEREEQVFRLIIEGHTAAQISDLLCISSKTVDKHRASVSRKLGTDTAIKMVQYAIRQGILDPSTWED